MKTDILNSTPVVPIVQSEDPAQAIATAIALKEGGVTVIEVVLRNDAAMACFEAIIKEVPDIVVGAGTVLTPHDVAAVAELGAQFIVSPGLNKQVIEASEEQGLPVFPGCVTASEIQMAWNYGISTVKFFPALLAGGVPMLKALATVFRKTQFMPTGGISPENLNDFLAIPSVIACGGSWLTPQAEIQAGNFEAVTALARTALQQAADLNEAD